jgi:hypothetical protein
VNIDRGSFLILVSTLAIGATSGYVASEKHVFPALDKWRGRSPEPTPEPPHPVVADAAPPVATPPPVPTPPPAPSAPPCDDSVASAGIGDCPAPGYPTIEGGCGSFANIRCGELKQAMKPKVAAAAVACLNKLTPQERCDPARVYLCGHLAFMNACPEREPEPTTSASAAGAPAAPSAAAAAVVATPGLSAPPPNPKSAAAICQSIVDGCGASPVAPSMAECRQLLSGMTETGRERTRACMKTHCFDRGLVGCEGVASK